MLRLPATAIGESGVIDTGSQAVALVACTTVNINLRTGDEQAALIDAYGRWLNSLSGPAQVTVSAQRMDLAAHATRITAPRRRHHRSGAGRRRAVLGGR